MTLLDKKFWDNKLVSEVVCDEAIDAFEVEADAPTVSSHGSLGSQPGALATPVIGPSTTAALV